MKTKEQAAMEVFELLLRTGGLMMSGPTKRYKDPHRSGIICFQFFVGCPNDGPYKIYWEAEETE